MTEPDLPTFSKLFDWAWAGVLALIGIIYKKNEAELTRQRDYIAKIFDKLEDHARRSEERDAEKMQLIHCMHTELLTALHDGLDRKADK